MHDLKNMQLMGGHQIIEGIRPETKLPIECHFYTETCDRLFIEKIAAAGANMLILPAEHFIGSHSSCTSSTIAVNSASRSVCTLVVIRLWPSLKKPFTTLTVCRSSSGVDETDGKDNWGWRRSAVDLVKRARKMIDEKNPKCELAIDGGLRHNNMEPLLECNPDVVILSSAIFKDPDGIDAAVKNAAKLWTTPQSNST